MAKLSKMELQAVAGAILREVKEAKLPSLIEAWEQKKIEVENSEVYLELKNWLKKHNLEEKSVINTYQLNHSLGLGQKPNIVSGLPTTQAIVDKLIISQISDSNITSIITSVKEELLTA